MKFAAYVALAFLLLAGGVMARLAYGPVSINFLDDYLATAISDAFDGAAVKFGATHLEWNGADGAFDVIFSNVEIDAGGQMQGGGHVPGQQPVADERAGYRIQLPQIGLGFSKAALFGGRIEPVSVDLYDSNLEINWSASALRDWAALRLDKTGNGPGAPEMIERNIVELGPMADVLKSLLRAPAEGEQLEFLERVSMSSGNVLVTERDSGAEWTLRDARFQFDRHGGDRLFEATMALEAAGESSVLNISTSRGEGEARRLKLEMKALNLAALARDVGLEGIFLALDLPLFGTLVADLGLDGVLSQVDMDLGAGEGSVDLPALYPERRDVAEATFTGRFEVAPSLLFVDSFYFAVGGGQIAGDGVADFSGELRRPDVKLFATVRDMDVDKILNYWPTRISPGTHGWITRNVFEGHLIEADFEIAMEPQMWGLRPVPASAVRIDFSFEGAAAHYLRGMPPLTKASGRATFNTDALDMIVTGGEVDGIPLQRSTYYLDKAGYRGQQQATVRLTMEAGIKDFLRLVDYKPLNYTTRFNIPADMLSGRALAVIDLNFPQRRGITVDDIQVKVEADITEGAMPDILRSGGLTDAAVRLNLDKRGIHASGRAKLNGAAFNVYWTELFGPVEPGVMTTRYELAGELSPEELSRFAGPLERFIDGNIHTHIEMDGLRGVPVRGTGEIDFFGAAITAKKLSWAKPHNSPGKAEFVFRWEEKTVEVDRIEIKAEGMETLGQFTFSRDDGALMVAEIAKLKTAGNDLKLVLNLDDNSRYDLVVEAQRIDARPFLDDLLVESTGEIGPLIISMTSEHVLALNGVGLSDVTMKAANSGEHWTSAELSLGMTGDSSVSMSLEGGEGKRKVVVTSDDAGRFARGAGLFLNGDGGALEVLAEMNAKGEPSYIDGMLRISDFNIVPSSRFVGAIAARTGKEVDKYLDDEGMKFSKLRLPFHATEGVIDIPDARANGPSIGFTLQGQVNRRSEQINLNGAIVPVYALNSLLGKVPLIGGLLTGGKGGGLFALAYRIEGSASEPKIDVKPLSALAPGFLRKIFEGPKGTVDVDEDEGEEPEDPDPAPEG